MLHDSVHLTEPSVLQNRIMETCMDLMSARFCCLYDCRKRAVWPVRPLSWECRCPVSCGPNVVILFLGNNGVTLFLLALDAVILMLNGIRKESHGSEFQFCRSAVLSGWKGRRSHCDGHGDKYMMMMRCAFGDECEEGRAQKNIGNESLGSNENAFR